MGWNANFTLYQRDLGTSMNIDDVYQLTIEFFPKSIVDFELMDVFFRNVSLILSKSEWVDIPTQLQISVIYIECNQCQYQYIYICRYANLDISTYIDTLDTESTIEPICIWNSGSGRLFCVHACMTLHGGRNVKDGSIMQPGSRLILWFWKVFPLS